MIAAQHVLADLTFCEGSEPMEGFLVELSTGTFCGRKHLLRLSVSQRPDLRQFPDWDDVRSGPGPIGVDSSV